MCGIIRHCQDHILSIFSARAWLHYIKDGKEDTEGVLWHRWGVRYYHKLFPEKGTQIKEVLFKKYYSNSVIYPGS